MKVLKILLGLAAVLAVVFLLGGWLLPERAGVSRSVDIERPPVQVFAVVNDLTRFNEFSPWADRDPEAVYRFEGPDSGVGATMHWRGDSAVGSGSMRIVESVAPVLVVTRLAFEGSDEPADARFEIEPLGATGSRVSWRFDARMEGLVGRWMGLILPRMIGADYRDGLDRLKTVVESAPVMDFSDLSVLEQQVPAQPVIALAASAPIADPDATAAVLGETYGHLLAFASEHGLEIAGSPLTLTGDLDSEIWRFHAALPVRGDRTVPDRGPVRSLILPAAAALVVEHVGPYFELPAAMARLQDYAEAHGHRRDGDIRAMYISDPAETPTESLVTRLVLPIRVP